MSIQTLDGVEYGVWPTRTAVPPVDRFTAAKDNLIEGCRREAAVLEGTALRSREWPWCRRGPGGFHLSLRVSGHILQLSDEGHLAVVKSSAEEAAKWYRNVIQEVEVGEWDSIIHEHIARIPPKKKRTS